MGLNRWREKTPCHYLYLKQIYALYPGAKVINLLRNPRAVFQSHQRVEWRTRSPFIFRKLFKKNLEVVNNYLEQTNRFMLVRFKYRLENPEKTTKKICGFLYIDYSRNMINSLNQKQFQNNDEDLEPWEKIRLISLVPRLKAGKIEGDERINNFLSLSAKKRT
ncbi:MAG: hypothetical protein PWQ17_1099 [Anaerophaga sp.]|nr:hypothetical protein [Anaerophaga sp.]MDN5292063.1 hypothetical protein [Anaerophaga sp.]